MHFRIPLCVALALLLGLTAQAYRLRLANTPDTTQRYQGTVVSTEGTGGHKETMTLWINENVGEVKEDVASVSRGITIVNKGSKHGENIIRYTASRSTRGEMTHMVVTSENHGRGTVLVIPVDERAIDIFGTTLLLPEGEVNIGDSWVAKGNTHFSLDSILPGKYDITNKLVGKLDFAGKTYLKISSTYTFIAPKQAGDAGANITFSFHGTTTFLFDSDAGIVTGMDVDFAGTVHDGREENDHGETIALKGLLRQTHQTMP